MWRISHNRQVSEQKLTAPKWLQWPSQSSSVMQSKLLFFYLERTYFILAYLRFGVWPKCVCYSDLGTILHRTYDLLCLGVAARNWWSNALCMTFPLKLASVCVIRLTGSRGVDQIRACQRGNTKIRKKQKFQKFRNSRIIQVWGSFGADFWKKL